METRGGRNASTPAFVFQEASELECIRSSHGTAPVTPVGWSVDNEHPPPTSSPPCFEERCACSLRPLVMLSVRLQVHSSAHVTGSRRICCSSDMCDQLHIQQYTS